MFISCDYEKIEDEIFYEEVSAAARPRSGQGSFENEF